MNDIIDEFYRRAEKRLAITESEPVLRLAEAFCFPSFHPEARLRVVERADGTMVRLCSLDAQLWAAEAGQAPRKFEESAVVPAASAERFWAALSMLAPLDLAPEIAWGLDGMTITATYQQRDAQNQFLIWSPEPRSPEGEFVGVIYRLAWEFLTGDASIRRLEQLHGYLDLGLPARLINGPVRRLRIFGRLTSSDDHALYQQLNDAAGDDPLLVDMTNFEGMGTLLYPIFARFAARRKNIAWAASPHARKQLAQIGVNDWEVFDTVDEALLYLGR